MDRSKIKENKGGFTCSVNQLYSTPIYPPPGSVLKLAPNATLIDLKMLKGTKNFKKPFRIEEVTVMIGENDSVKVLDYGPKDRFATYSFINKKPNNFYKAKNLSSPYESNWKNSDIAAFDQIYDPSLGKVLENMRQLHIDCNIALMDMTRKYTVYAHVTVLISKSPYFFRELYLKEKHRKNAHPPFCKFKLPLEVDYSSLDAVISFIYTGSLQYIFQKASEAVRELLELLEMKEALDVYDWEMKEENRIPDVSQRSREAEIGESVTLLPCVDGQEGQTSVIEIQEENEREKRKKRNYGKLKVSVQKMIDCALNPFLMKIEELLAPSGNALRIAKSSQHIITLWHADILLTKLFDQIELTKFFSEVANELLEKNSDIITSKGIIENCEIPGENLQVSYVVASLCTQTENTVIDDSYTQSCSSIDDVPYISIETVDVDDNQIVHYQKMIPKHIPKYVHIIAMYRYCIVMKNVDYIDGKDDLMPSILHHDANEDVVIEDLVNHIVQNEELLGSDSIPPLSRSYFGQVITDLKKKVITDLEIHTNPAFHEELIIHIILDKIDSRNLLPLTLAVFLAKGCNFCRKKECRVEDLTMPISPDTPVCPDRQCIKQNLKCNICDKQMATSKSLARHKYSVHELELGHPNGIFICSHCGETFIRKWKLNMHEREHEDRKLELVCNYCNKSIRGSVSLKKHINLVHETKPQFECEYCPKTFKRKETLVVHLRIHTGDKPFKCTDCKYASETKGNLKMHIMRKHKVDLLGTSEQIGNERALTVSTLEDDQVMTDSLVTHSLRPATFIITSETSPSSIVS